MIVGTGANAFPPWQLTRLVNIKGRKRPEADFQTESVLNSQEDQLYAPNACI